MINCIIVDDEPLARQLIASYVDQVADMNCLGRYSTAMEAFAALHQHHVDVIFLDIEMPGITGLNFIKSLKVCSKIIFITAYTSYAVDAFEIEATDYLVKPVTFERFLKAIQKLNLPNKTSLVTMQPADITFIFLKVEKKLIKVELAEMMYVESMGDYLKVHTTHQVYIIYMTLNKLESLVPASRFIRIHRSTIINTSFISFIEGNFIMINSVELPIGLTYRDGLMKRLG